MPKIQEIGREKFLFIVAKITKTTIDKGEVKQAWKAEHSASGMRYKLDLEHPAISSVIEMLVIYYLI